MAETTRPLLLPQNRRIRHLRGICLRNLSFDRSPRGRTADDSAVKHSPDKVASLREHAGLHHSASTESLRPRPATARRRSTNLGSASPVTRQKRLELTIDSRVADSFFTLHAEDEEEPLYISETVERSVVRMRSEYPLLSRAPRPIAMARSVGGDADCAAYRTSTSDSSSCPRMPARRLCDCLRSRSSSGRSARGRGHSTSRSSWTCAR